MKHLVLKLEGILGSSVLDILEDAILIAQDLRVVVEVEINEIGVSIDGYVEAAKIVEAIKRAKYEGYRYVNVLGEPIIQRKT